MKCKRLMSYCQRAQVSCRLPYLQVPRLIHKVQKFLCLMIETAKSNQAKAKRKLGAVREKQNEVNTNNQKLLEKALPADVSAVPSKKRKSK